MGLASKEMERGLTINELISGGGLLLIFRFFFFFFFLLFWYGRLADKSMKKESVFCFLVRGGKWWG